MIKIYGSATPDSIICVRELVGNVASKLGESLLTSSGTIDFVITPTTSTTRLLISSIPGVILHPSLHNPDPVDADHITKHLSHLTLPEKSLPYHVFAAMRDAHGFEFDPDI